MKVLRSRVVFASIVAAFSILLPGCGGNDNDQIAPPTAQVRTLNTFIPAPGGSSTVVVAANGTSLTGAGGVSFGQFANGGSFVTVPAGTFSPVGTGSSLASNIQFTTSPSLTTNGAFTLAIAGQSSQSGALAPQFVLIPTPASSQLNIPSGSAAIRVVNLSGNSNNIGLFNTTGGVPTTAVNAGVSTVPFGFSAANNSFVTVPTSQLTNLGIVDATNNSVTIPLAATSNLNTMTFLPGHAYTFYTFGVPGSLNQPFSGIWIQEF